MVTPGEGNLYSLDDVWEEFDASAGSGDDPEDAWMELATQLTLTLPDSRSATGRLTLVHYDTTPPGRVNVELHFDALSEGSTGLIYITPIWEEGWTKEKLIKALNIAPDSRIWEVGTA